MRHSCGDQTDGYTLAGLSEMYEAIKRLPSRVQAVVATQAMTGTGNNPIAPQVDMRWTRNDFDRQP